MARVFEYGSTGLFVRDTSGNQVFASTDRMLGQLGTQSFSGVTVNFPIVPGEVTQFDFIEGVRRVIPQTTIRTETVTLGAHSGPVPDIIFGAVRCTSYTLGDLNADDFYTPFFGLTDWVSMPGGSAFIEFATRDSGTGRIRWLNRHIDIGVSGGNWVLNKRQSNAAFTTPWRLSIGTTESTFTMDFQISYGFLDL